MDQPRIALFGPPSLRVRETPARFRTRKQAGLLTYLALEGRDRPVGREQIIELFWPGVSPDLARHSLSQALTAIRQHLGDDAVVGTGDSIQLRAAVTTDLDALAAGDRAPALEEPLAGLDTCAGPALAHWVDGARTRSKRAARDALIEQMARLRTAGEVAEVHDRARTLIELDPHCESAITALAERALLRGDGVGAIRLLREHAQRAEAELGIAPSQDLSRLLKRLEAGSHPPIDVGLSSPGQDLVDGPFVGRAAEMATLEAAWSRARGGALETILLLGPAGIGKSSLLRRFATGVAARAAPVFHVTCQEIGHGVPFAVLGDLVSALARDPGLSGTDPLWLAEASRICPSLRTTYPGIPEAPPAPADSIRLRLGEALFQMLASVADGSPCLLAFDDVQHMDPASRDVLFVVARRLATTRTLIVGAARTPEGGTSWRRPEDSEGLAWHHEVPVSPLTKAEAVELVDLLEPRAAQVGVTERIGDLGQGNPYFIEMLLDDWEQHSSASLVSSAARGDGSGAAWQPPPTMRSAFERQYSGLSDTARQILQLLAVASRALTAEEACRTLATSVVAAERSLLELADRGVLRVDGGGATFKNELHRAYVYYGLPVETRLYYHFRFASALLGSGSGGEDFKRSLEASMHFQSAGAADEARTSATRGARLAIAGGAPKEAERALRAVRSITTGPADAELQCLLGEAYARQGMNAEAIAALAEISGDTDRVLSTRALVIRACAIARGRIAPENVVLTTTQQAVDAAEDLGNLDLLLEAMHARAEAAADSLDLNTLSFLSARAAEVTAGASGVLATRAAVLRAFCAFIPGHLKQCHDALVECVQSDVGANWPMALNGLGICLTGLGRYSAAISAFRRSLSAYWQAGDLGGIRNVLGNLGVLFHDLGWFERAARYHRNAASLERGMESPRSSVQVRVNCATLAIEAGLFEEASTLLEEATAFAQKANLWHLAVDVLATQADIALAKGDPQGAWLLVERAMLITGNRSQGLADQGQYNRLVTHRAFALGGLEGAMDVSRSLEPVARSINQALEAQLFDSWIAGQDVERSADSPALREVLRRSLVGVLARVAASRPTPHGFGHPVLGMVGAAFASKIVHGADGHVLPSVILGPSLQVKDWDSSGSLKEVDDELARLQALCGSTNES